MNALARDDSAAINTASKPVDRYVVLDGLRGLAAFAIVVHHFTLTVGSRELFASASIAVDFFFCLSGFVIAHAYYARLRGGMPLADFARRRLSRLYPMYLVGTLLGIVATLSYMHTGRTNLTYANLATATALNAFYIPYLNAHWMDVFVFRLEGTIFPMNNPAWSLLFGMVANFTFAASLRWSTRLPLVMAGVAAVGLCMATFAFGEAPGWGTANMPGGFPRVFFSFFAGIVIFQYHARTAALPRVQGMLIIILVCVAVAVPRFSGHRFYWLAMVLLVVPLIVAMGSQCAVSRTSMSRRVFAYCGSISYTVFCVHYPLLMFFSLANADPANRALLLVAYLAVTFACAHLLTAHVERPMRDWLAARLHAR